MPQQPVQFRPLPETDVINGQPTDIGYDPADWEAMQRESRTYERRAMEDIQVSKIEKKTRSEWVDFYQSELDAADPGFLSNVWRAVAPNAKEVLTEVGKAVPAAAAGAVVDTAVITWHLGNWLASNMDLINRGDYSFLEDMPDFKNIPGSSDYIADKYFGSDVDSMGYLFGSLLSPDPAKAITLVNKAGAFYGLSGFLNHLDTVKKTQPEVANTMIANFEEAKKLAESGATTKDMMQKTGWMNINNEWRFLMDLKQMNVKHDHMVEVLTDYVRRNAKLINDSEGTLPFSKSFVLQDLLDHEVLFQAYPDFKFMTTRVYVQKAIPGEAGYRFTVDGEEYVISGGGSLPKRGAEFVPKDNSINLFGTSHGDVVKRFEQQIMHEVEHSVQRAEGFSRGGSPQEFAELADFNTVSKDYITLQLLDDMEAVDNTMDFTKPLDVWNHIRTTYPKVYENIPAEEQEDFVIEVVDSLRRISNSEQVDRDLELALLGGSLYRFAEFYRLYRGSNKEEDLINALETMDAPLVNAITQDMYYALRGEGYSRMSETLTRLRETFDANTFDPEAALKAEFTNLPEGRLPILNDDGSLRIIDLEPDQILGE